MRGFHCLGVNAPPAAPPQTFTRDATDTESGFGQVLNAFQLSERARRGVPVVYITPACERKAVRHGIMKHALCDSANGIMPVPK